MRTHNIMFLWRTDENEPSVIIKYPPYLVFWTTVESELEFTDSAPDEHFRCTLQAKIVLHFPNQG